MSDQAVVQFQGVRKRYGRTVALDGVDLAIPPDTIVGVLGPNGGGKTTLLRHVPGLLLPTAGTVTTFGTRADRLDATQMARIGYVSQESELVGWLSTGEMIDFVRASQPRWNQALAERLARGFDLDPSKRVSALSTGQRQRLAILLAVAHEPDLLLLDEPAASLDPVARQDFLALLMEMIQTSGRAILISSHILTDIEKVVDRVLILDGGRVQYHGTLDDLRDRYHRVELQAAGAPLPATLPLAGVRRLERDDRTAIATIADRSREDILRELAGLDCRSRVENLEFEDIYRLIVTRK